MSKTRITIVFECDSKKVPRSKGLHPLEISNLVLGALLDQKLQIQIEKDTPDE
jgi:hypothetical protein